MKMFNLKIKWNTSTNFFLNVKLEYKNKLNIFYDDDQQIYFPLIKFSIKKIIDQDLK